MIAILRVLVLIFTVPLTVATLALAFIYTGIVRRGIWMVVNICISIPISVFNAVHGLTATTHKARGNMATLVTTTFVCLCVLYQDKLQLPYYHFLTYLNSIEHQFLGLWNWTDSSSYWPLTQSTQSMYALNFRDGNTTDIMHFWQLGTDVVKQHINEKHAFFFFIDELRWMQNLIIIPKTIYVFVALYALWLTALSRTVDWLLTSRILKVEHKKAG